MLEYWLQNGEAQARFIESDEINDILSPIFQGDGSLTCLSRSLFSQLNVRNLTDLSRKLSNSLKKFRASKKRACSFCGNMGATKLKGWMFPFVIEQSRFPNLYPSGKVESMNVCKDCLLRSLKAYAAIIFSGQRQGGATHINALLFFSDDSTSLADFKTLMQDAVLSEYYTNWKPKVKRDLVYYPYEFLTQVLEYISKKLHEQEPKRRLGALVISFSQMGKSKRLYEFVEVVAETSPLLVALKSINSEKNRFFPFFRSMRKEVRRELTPDAFIERNSFFRTLLLYRDINWGILEDAMFYRLSIDKPIVNMHYFVKEVMEVLSHPDAQYYEAVSRQGWLLGKALLDMGEKLKSVRAAIYELRRERDDPGKFLDLVNDLQLRAEVGIDDRVFREHEEMFLKLRTFFLIGMTNALFQKASEKREGEADES